jgi:hypothetical protein
LTEDSLSAREAKESLRRLFAFTRSKTEDWASTDSADKISPASVAAGSIPAATRNQSIAMLVLINVAEAKAAIHRFGPSHAAMIGKADAYVDAATFRTIPGHWFVSAKEIRRRLGRPDRRGVAFR